MNERNELLEYPEELRVGKTWLRRSGDRYAVPGPLPAELRPAVLQELGEEMFVLRGTPPAGRVSGRIAAVYVDESARQQVVATGRLFVRAGKGSDIRKLQDTLRATGYRLDEVPAYAPHAAWLVAVSGRGGDALAGLERLLALRGIEAAEPELLRPPSARGPRP